MQFPYFYTFTLRSPLSIAELKTALQTSSAPGWQPRSGAAPSVIGPAFDARYAPHVADTSLRKYQLLKLLDPATGARLYPKCYLRAEEQGTWCRVELKFRPVLFFSIFMTIWTSGMLFGTLGIASETLLHHPSQAPVLLVLTPFYFGFWFFHRVTYSGLIPPYLQRLRELLHATAPDGPLPPAGSSRPQPALPAPPASPTYAP